MEWQKIVMEKSKKQWVNQFNEIINIIEGNRFSSHDFIGKFCCRFEPEWKQMLARYETNATQKVNAYLARMFSLYEKDLPIQKEAKPENSKNIHASLSRVHWWEKLTMAFFLFFMWKGNMQAEDKYYENPFNYFLQQIKGWEWVYLENPRTEEIKTPYLYVRYQVYDSHPEYRFITDGYDVRKPKTDIYVFDTDGNFVRKLTEWEGTYNTNKIREQATIMTNRNMDSIYDSIADKLKEIPSFQVNQIRKKDSDKESFYMDSLITDFVRFITRKEDSDITRKEVSDNELFYMGSIKKQTKKNLNIAKNIINQINNQHIRVDIKIPNHSESDYFGWIPNRSSSNSDQNNCDIYCYFDSQIKDSLYTQNYNNAFSEGFEKVSYISEEKDCFKGMILRSYPHQREMLKDTLCKRQMTYDYLSNKYDVKSNESAETCMLIEQKLGLRPTPAPISVSDEEARKIRSDIVKKACNTLGLPNDEKYLELNTDELVKEVKKYHPDWTTVEIYDRWYASIHEAAEDFTTITMPSLILDNISAFNIKNEKAANHYLDFLKNEYKYYVTDVKRLDDTTFQATIEMTPAKTIHKVIIRYVQTKPYECDVEIESNSQMANSANI